jgi:outer membrane receptor for monomeric catechols
LVNIVSEETFGAMHAGNIGYALQKLPGITVNEDEDGTPGGVNIRGLGGDFNSFTLDGNRIGTRGFSTSNLVADGIANIEVIKAATPDRRATPTLIRRHLTTPTFNSRNIRRRGGYTRWVSSIRR